MFHLLSLSPPRFTCVYFEYRNAMEEWVDKFRLCEHVSGSFDLSFIWNHWLENLAEYY
jgi:hypothetical protein